MEESALNRGLAYLRRLFGKLEVHDAAGLRQIAYISAGGVAAFAIDLAVGPAIATGILYLVPVFLALQSNRPRSTILAASIGTFFGLLELGITLLTRYSTISTTVIVVNRFLAILLLWAAALFGTRVVRARLLRQRMREARLMTDQLRRSRDGLEERVRDRTRELSQLNDELRHEIGRRRLAETRVRQSEAHHRSLSLSLQEAVRRTDAFLATLSHELRNPLAPLRNSAQALRLISSNDQAVHRHAAIIERQAAQLARLLEDLLDISRCQTDSVVLRKSRLDLTEVVRTLTDDFTRVLQDRGLTLSLSLPDSVVWVDADRARLVQAISNVLLNAAYFTSSGGQVSMKVHLPASDGVDIVVTDTGMGMNTETLSRIFEPFRGVKRRADGSPGGLGLGLSVSQRLIRLHGGTISARSEGPGHGSEFTLHLPRMSADAMNFPTPTAPTSHTDLRIVVIDDHPDTADSTRALLELAGHQVTVAYRAKEGLDAATRDKPDVIFCDIELSDVMDGYAVARALRANPELRGTYLVAITGYGRARDKDRAREAGFDLHLTKPVDLVLLERTLANRSRPVQRVGHTVS